MADQENKFLPPGFNLIQPTSLKIRWLQFGPHILLITRGFAQGRHNDDFQWYLCLRITVKTVNNSSYKDKGILDITYLI